MKGLGLIFKKQKIPENQPPDSGPNTIDPVQPRPEHHKLYTMNFNMLLNGDTPPPDHPKSSAPRLSIDSMMNEEGPKSKEKVVKKTSSIQLLLSNPDTPAKVSKPQAKKPKRYTTIPVWARTWRPPHAANAMALENSQTLYSDELDVLITRVVPYEDLTRKISQWLYSHLTALKNTDERNIQNIEFEVKFGRIWSKENDARIALPVSTETILTDHIGYLFKPGLEEPMFMHMAEFTRNTLSKNTLNKVSHFDMNDLFYRGVRSADNKPYDLRISKDTETGRVLAKVEKRRIGDIFIYNPSDALDLRLTLSLEIPIPEVPRAVTREPPEMTRRKVRTSHTIPSCKCNIDLTKVFTLSDKRVEDQSFEVEIEVDSGWLLDAFERTHRQGVQQTYEDTVRVMMNNARILNRALAD